MDPLSDRVPSWYCYQNVTVGLYVLLDHQAREDPCDDKTYEVIRLQEHLRKEVIQPHLPVRLPCYDFAPITGLTLDAY